MRGPSGSMEISVGFPENILQEHKGSVWGPVSAEVLFMQRGREEQKKLTQMSAVQAATTQAEAISNFILRHVFEVFDMLWLHFQSGTITIKADQILRPPHPRTVTMKIGLKCTNEAYVGLFGVPG